MSLTPDVEYGLRWKLEAYALVSSADKDTYAQCRPPTIKKPECDFSVYVDSFNRYQEFYRKLSRRPCQSASTTSERFSSLNLLTSMRISAMTALRSIHQTRDSRMSPEPMAGVGSRLRNDSAGHQKNQSKRPAEDSPSGLHILMARTTARTMKTMMKSKNVHLKKRDSFSSLGRKTLKSGIFLEKSYRCENMNVLTKGDW